MPISDGRLTHMFVVRLWLEPDLYSTGQWRGLVEHIPCGQRRYFAALADLDDFITLRLAGNPAGAQSPGTPNEAE
jgi:hypothetical protein